MTVEWSAAAGTLRAEPASDRADAVAWPVRVALSELPAADVRSVGIVDIDPDLADTAAFCEHYGSPLELSANCVVVSGKRAGEVRHAACVVRADMRVDVNGAVRRRMAVRKASFLGMDDAVELSGMAYGGITPLGLPREWPLLVDPAVARAPVVVIGSGVRRSKLLVPGELLTRLPNSEVSPQLAQ